ncbi:MAG: NAD(P)H:quinone oxidoreductase, type IV [Maritimibacter sp.]|nr:NAD(P)H:quinone oxidoreductase, type IV [Maritimibacter sp.]
MTAPKITIAYYSTYGTNYQVALEAKAAAEAAGAEARLRRFAETAPKEVVEGQDAWKEQLEKTSDIPEINHDDMEWADGYFFLSPTRYGQPASQVRAFIDTLGPLWQAGKLINKTFTASTSAQTLHGGHEMTTMAMYVSAMHWGTIIVAPGYTDPILFETGNPYGYSAIAGELPENGKKAVAHQAKRLVETTAKIIG